jgi:hypothetical protein
MPSTEEKTPSTTNGTWKKDLQQVGFVRRLFQARNWYGADWWFVAISTFMVIGFIFVALFPGSDRWHQFPWSGGVPGCTGADRAQRHDHYRTG